MEIQGIHYFCLDLRLRNVYGKCKQNVQTSRPKKEAAPTAEKLHSRNCRAYRKNKKICNVKKSLLSQMITVSTKTQSEQSFCQAHAIRSTELKPTTPRSGKTKTCTGQNIPNQNMNTNLDLFFMFFMILNHKQNTMY